MKNRIRIRKRELRIMTAKVLIAAIFLTFCSMTGTVTDILPKFFPDAMTAFAASGSEITGGGDKTATGSQIGEEDGEKVLFRAAPSNTWLDCRDAEWDGGSIRTADELAQFAYLVSDGNDFDGETVSLAEDIDLKGRLWTPISGKFSGTFNGKNHSVTGMSVDAGAADGIDEGCGFFEVLQNAEIKNLRISGDIKFGMNGSPAVCGGIAAKVYNSELENCSTAITIRPAEGEDEPAKIAVGTICGTSADSRFINCVSRGSVTVHRIKGKEAGFLLHAGGMSGTAENCVFTECVNDADVIGDIEYDDGERNAQILGGGLAGTATGCRFTECVNRADVKCAMACGENDAAAMLHAGGIAAKAVGETLFDQCSNQGSISAEGYNVYSGGIASYIVEAAAVNCVNHGSVLARSSWEAISGGICAFGGATGQFDFTAKVANCANYGRVNSETDDGNVWSGGILGSSMSISTEPFLIENCVSGGTLTGEGTGGAEPGYRTVAGLCAYGTKTVIRHCFWLGSTAQEPVILDEGEDPAASTAVFDSAIYDRKNGSCLLREEISGTYSLTEALNLWAGEHSGEDGFDFDGWRMKDGKASPAAGLAPSAALDLEHTGDRDAAGRSAGSRGKSGFSPKWTQDERGWRYQTSPVEFTAGDWANLYWDGAYYWYHFNAEGYLDTGWFTDTDGAVYYLHPLHDGKYGYMYTGLNSIDGKEYYFETETGKGKGALYRNRTTPDGRTADKSGALLP